MKPDYECESFCDHRWNKKDFEQVCDYARYRFGDIACPKCGHTIIGWRALSKEEQSRLKQEVAVMQQMYHEAQKQLWEVDQAKKQNKKRAKRRSLYSA